jgi:DeoR/GlpR family transcriptional regulator of sugar metabolism
MEHTPRQKEILEILKEKNYVTVDYLSKEVHSSTSSIRRDLTFLENEGIVRRSHGGVTLLTTQPHLAPFAFRLHESRKEKAALAKAASKLIKPDTSIYIDSSTSTLHLYRYLTPDMNITVFTNNVQLVQILASNNITTYCIGGLISTQNKVITIGSFALDMIRNIYVDTMFFASSALSTDGIITDIDETETAIRRELFSHAKTKVFLCQSKRFGERSRFFVAGVSQLDYIVSDLVFPLEFREEYKNITYITT